MSAGVSNLLTDCIKRIFMNMNTQNNTNGNVEQTSAIMPSVLSPQPESASTWIGGSLLAPAKVSESDPFISDVVFWFDTTTGAALTAKIAKPVAPNRCVRDTLVEHLLDHHQRHSRFPAKIQLIDDYCAEEIAKVLPRGIAVEIVPVVEFNNRIRAFIAALGAFEDAKNRSLELALLSAPYTQKLVENHAFFDLLGDSLEDNNPLGQSLSATEQHVSVEPSLEALLWRDPCPFPQLGVISEDEDEDEDDSQEPLVIMVNPWLEPFLNYKSLPDMSELGLLKTRVLVGALWDFRFNRWSVWFRGWGLNEMTCFLAEFGAALVCRTEAEACFALEVVRAFFAWVVTTEDVQDHEKHKMLEVFHSGLPALETEVLANVSKEASPAGIFGEALLAKPEKKSAQDSFKLDPEPLLETKTKIGRNQPCPCGSGKKHKKCCWAKLQSINH